MSFASVLKARTPMQRLRTFLVAAAGTGLLVGLQASAHHSVSGQFDVTKKVVLTGTVERVDWVNPHIYVHLKVTDPQASAGVWQLGTVPVAMARRAGITKESLLAAGQTVKITAYPARDGSTHLGFLTRVDYPDGKFISVNPDRL
jgi:Family of unknown function (DUF6152)